MIIFGNFVSQTCISVLILTVVFLYKKENYRVDKMAQQIKVLAAKLDDDLSSIPGSTDQKESIPSSSLTSMSILPAQIKSK